jgi:hypothetical protein
MSSQIIVSFRPHAPASCGCGRPQKREVENGLVFLLSFNKTICLVFFLEYDLHNSFSLFTLI